MGAGGTHKSVLQDELGMWFPRVWGAVGSALVVVSEGIIEGDVPFGDNNERSFVCERHEWNK